MMRGRDAVAVAVRHPDGGIVTATEHLDSVLHRSRFARAPLFRGVVLLYETLVVGTRWLMRSGSIAAAGEGVEMGRGTIAVTLGVTFAFAIGLFVILPLFLSQAATDVALGPGQAFIQHLVEGLIRIALFVGYLLIVSRAPDIAPRLPLPRRRAHDHPRPRARRPADHREHPPVPDRPSALRHRVPGRLRHRQHPGLQPAGRSGPDRQHRRTDPAHPGHRGRLLRAAPLRCAPPGEQARALDLHARHLAPARSPPSSPTTT